MVTSKEKGQLAIKIMVDICDYFDTHHSMTFKDFAEIQKGRHKQLDMAIKNDAKLGAKEC